MVKTPNFSSVQLLFLLQLFLYDHGQELHSLCFSLTASQCSYASVPFSLLFNQNREYEQYKRSNGLIFICKLSKSNGLSRL